MNTYIDLYLICLYYTRGADIRHTSHGSPQTTPKYGKAAPVWVAVPIIGVCSFSLCGDCETIEQYVLENVQVRNPCVKIVNFFEISIRNERKHQKYMLITRKRVSFEPKFLSLSLFLKKTNCPLNNWGMVSN